MDDDFHGKIRRAEGTRELSRAHGKLFRRQLRLGTTGAGGSAETCWGGSIHGRFDVGSHTYRNFLDANNGTITKRSGTRVVKKEKSQR